MPHPRRWRALPALIAVLLALAPTALAQNCALEVEPNDAPATATPLDGRGCLVGTLDGSDQDAWWWVVDQEASEQVWQVELDSFPGHLTKLDLVRVEIAANGDVTGAETLLTLGTPDGRQVRSEPFLVAPGRYLLGFSKSGGSGEYVLHLQPGDALSRRRTPAAPLVDRGVAGAFAAYGVLDGRLEIPWTIDAAGAGVRWAIEAQGAVDATVSVELLDPSGARVVRTSASASAIAALRSLGLQPGEHRLVVEGQGPFTIAALETGTLTDGDEVEPNDSFERANVLRFDRPMRATGTDADYFVIAVGPDEAGRPWDLHVETSADVEVRLYDGARTELQRRRGNGGALRGLVLAEGDHYLYVAHGTTDPYTLRFAPGETVQDGFEQEPNDTLATRDRLSEELTMRGTLTLQDRDVFRFSVEGAAQLWRVQAIGEGVTELAVHAASGAEIDRVREPGRPRLDQLVLLPGDHFVEVRGDSGAYALRLLPQGPAPEPPAPEPTAATAPPAPLPATAAGTRSEEPAAAGPPPPPGVVEAEPNGDASRAEPLVAGVVRVGTIGGPDDRDVYRFLLAEDHVVRLELASPEGSAVHFDLAPFGGRAAPPEPGGLAWIERRLPAGSYQVDVVDREGAGGWYQLRLTLPDPLTPHADREPNDDVPSAAPWPAEPAWDGHVGEFGDDDHYRLPSFATGGRLRLVAQPAEALQLSIVGDAAGLLRPDADGVVELDLPANATQTLRVRGRGAYRLEATFDPAPDPSQLAAPNGDPRALASFEADVATVQAYGPDGQRLDATLVVENASDAARTFDVEAVLNLPDARLEAPARVEVPAGGRVEVPVAALLPPDLRDDLPVRWTIGLRDDLGVATATSTVVPVCEAPPIAPMPHWPLPEPLLGRLDLAWTALGARPLDDSGRTARLFGGRVAPSTGLRLGADEPVDVELAGGAPVRLVGTVLHPLTFADVPDQLRGFEVWTSMDGVAYERVLRASLRAARIGQGFAFDAPVTARFARLVTIDAQNGRSNAVLGSWQLLGDDATDLGPLNLADPAAGGHVVWAEPVFQSRSRILDADAGSVRLDLRGVDLTFVVGFHHGRAAQATRIEWQADVDEGRSAQPTEVAVSASLEGPLGPWTELGTWPLATEGTSVLELEAPTWVRYLRFETPAPDDGSGLLLPAQVRVIERTADAGYRSALGSWGYDARTASFEFHADGGGATVALLDDADGVDDDAPERARTLRSGAAFAGTVAVAEDVDWLRVVVPAGENLLELRLEGDPAIRYQFVDATGAAVVHDVVEDGDGRVLRAFVEPGAYLLGLEEPRRSVAFVWDNSGSMGPYIGVTYTALARFTQDLDPAREFVQLGVFADNAPIRWLLPYWSADAARAQRALTEYPRTDGSSDAFPALLAASDALGDRDGVRAILLITDAETGGQGAEEAMWRSFDAVRPRVFTFEVSSAGNDEPQDLMQSWAYAAGGDYRLATGVGDLDAGFARAACLLRRPKAYRVEVTTAYEAPPGPGTLRVVRGEGAAQPAVEVIFDASGSMGQRLPSGESRIEVAKAVLEEFVRTGLPDDVPFALRAFGHITPNSCETRLDLPLAPLDRNAALAAVRAIEPKLFSQTPIAASIEAVAADLAGSAGPKSILLITDGVESCDGDPRAAVEGLRAGGMDVQLSIVSLGLDDPEDVAAFEALAEAVGASYVGTNDVAGLREAVLAALAVPYQVLSLDGTVLATGRVDGDPVELPAGRYRVRVGTELLEARVPGDGAVEVATGR
jgi:hypothetical protein